MHKDSLDNKVLHIILCLVIGLCYSNAIPILTPHPKQKEIKPESELSNAMGCHSNVMGRCFMG